MFTARNGTLELPELETFKKQAGCLNFHTEYYFGSTGQTFYLFPMEENASLILHVCYFLLFHVSLVPDVCADSRETSTAAENTETTEMTEATTVN